MVVLFLASALPIGAIWGGHRLEQSPSFCNSCHEMQPSVAAWKTSGADQGHPDCITCHSGAGLAGVLESQVRGLRMIGVHFFGSPKPISDIRATMPETFCLKCHAADAMVEVHAPFQTAGQTCGDCHKHRAGWKFKGQMRQE